MHQATDPTVVTVLHAGALTWLVREGLGPALTRDTGIEVRSVPGHSLALADAIREGRQRGDLYLSADAELNATLLGSAGGDRVRWYITFAHNAIVLIYSPASVAFTEAVQGRTPWYTALTQPGVRLGRNDPDDDPGGYYAVFVCQLAEEHYGIRGLAQQILGEWRNPAQVGQMDLGRLARGDLDACLIYRSAALTAGIPYLELPNAINLSDPAYASDYRRARYTTTAGRQLHGVPIGFTATVLSDAANPTAAIRLLAMLLSPAGQDLLQRYHFLLSPDLPQAGGNRNAIPDALVPYIA